MTRAELKAAYYQVGDRICYRMYPSWGGVVSGVYMVELSGVEDYRYRVVWDAAPNDVDPHGYTADRLEREAF